MKGISTKNMEEHLKLYHGYIKNVDLIKEKITELNKDKEKNQYLINELYRRFSFEYNGMRNHEIYFSSFEGGPAPIPEGSLKDAIVNNWGSVKNWLEILKSISMTRGIGWAMLYFDPKDKTLINSWVDEQHLGQLQGCIPIVALDMWEHAYVMDYLPSGKKNYIEDFFENINWQKISDNFQTLISK